MLYKHYCHCFNFLLHVILEKALEAYITMLIVIPAIRLQMVFKCFFFFLDYLFTLMFCHTSQNVPFGKEREKRRRRKIFTCFCHTKFCYYKKCVIG